MVVAAGTRIACALVVAAALGAGLVACGAGDDPADARREITRTLRTSLTTTDPQVLCGETLSTALVTRVYGSLEQCLAVESRSAATRNAPGEVAVSAVSIDGDRGSAAVAVRGGDQDGVRGGLSVVRQDGAWRLDDLSTAFLRSSVDAGLSSGGDLQGVLVACVGKKVAGLDDASLRAIALGAMGGRPAAQERLRGLVGECVAALGAPPAGESA